MKRCTRCLLPEGQLNVSLNEDGVCNYCGHWQSNESRFNDYGTLKPLLLDRIEKLGGKSPVDVLIGYSGGKDSSYVAYSVSHRYGLNARLLTVNNGFLNDYARRNISRMLDKLNLPHVFHHFDEDLQRSLYRAAFETYADPCVGCAIPLYYYSFKYAYENEIPMIIHGRTPYQIFRNYYPGSKDTFLELHLTNYEPHSYQRLAEIYQGFADDLKRWLGEMFPNDKGLQQKAYDEVFFDVASADPSQLPDFIGLFQYEQYDEEKIKSELEAAIGYQRPSDDIVLGHGDCDIHAASAYLLRSVHSNVTTLTEIASMLRLGAFGQGKARELITRYESLETKRPADSISALCNGSGITPEQFDDIAQNPQNHKHKRFANH